MSKSKGIFTIYTREEFLNYLSQTTFSRSIGILQNHHTYKPNYASFNKHGAFAVLEGMRNYHIQTNKWDEIGQNITTFPDGTIAICRPINKAPCGIKGANKAGICMEHLGDFDTNKDVMTEEHRLTILFVNAALCHKFHLEPNSKTIVYHHWYDLKSGARTNGSGITKSCPGTNFFGGNSVDDAEKNFIPLVQTDLNLIKNQGKVKVESRKGKVKANSLRVRTAPSLSGEIIRVIPQGKELTIYMELNGWYKIEKSSEAWVAANFIELQTTN